jgi:membrane-bound lytic murein transglycosylase D
MKRSLSWILFTLLIIMLVGFFIYSDKYRGISEEEFNEGRNSHLKVFALDLPDSLLFAGEKVPMDLFWVREAYDRELLTNVYWHSSTFLMLKRTPRYFPVIEPILKKYGIPDDFKYLALAESNFSNAVSPAGAAGFWQFLKETGQKYGLEINEEIDERYNLEKSTQAACKYLNEAYVRFGSWTLAAAAYNAGMENVSKPLAVQKSSSFYETLLNQETSRYIFRILAIREVYLDPPKYGFHLRNKDFYPAIPSQNIQVDTTISDLASFALTKGINYKILKEFNPWLRKNTLTIRSDKVYTLKIPEPQSIFYSKLREEQKED